MIAPRLLLIALLAGIAALAIKVVEMDLTSAGPPPPDWITEHFRESARLRYEMDVRSNGIILGHMSSRAGIKLETVLAAQDCAHRQITARYLRSIDTMNRNTPQ